MVSKTTTRAKAFPPASSQAGTSNNLFFPSNPDSFYRWKTTWKHSLKRERIFSRDCNSSTVISGCVSTLHHHRSCFLLSTLYLAADTKAPPQLPTLVIQARMADNWVFDSLVNFLRGPIWNVPILTLIENKSLGRV